MWITLRYILYAMRWSELWFVRGWRLEEAIVIVMVASLSLTISYSIGVIDSDRRGSNMLVVVM